MVSYENPGLSSASWNGELAFAQTKLLAENSWGGGGAKRDKNIYLLNGLMAVKSKTGFLEARSQREGEPRNLNRIYGVLFFFFLLRY